MCANCADPSIAGCFTPVRSFYGRHIYTMFAFMLPYIEQDNIYNLLTPSGYAGGQYFELIKTYICPSDPSVNAFGFNQTAFGGARNWGASSYGGNNYVFGDPPNGRQAQIDRCRRVLFLFEIDPVPEDHGAIERQARF